MARFSSVGSEGDTGVPGPQGPQGPQGDAGSQGPAGDPFGIYYLGDYISTNGYVTDIAVVRGSDSQLYLAKASGQLGDPINYQSNEQWEVWIPKGQDGSNGAPGSDGQDGAPGADGLDGADGSTPFTLIGAYDNGASYNLGIAVYYNGGTYVRTGNPLNPGYPPEPGTINASWTPIADKGEQGDPGAQGEPGLDGDPLDFLNVASNIIPTTANFYTLGTVDHRWADLFLGPSTINIIDQSLGTSATIGIANGIFFINGVEQAQLPNIAVTNLTFADNTVQTTAYTGAAGVSGNGEVARYSPNFQATGLTFTGTGTTYPTYNSHYVKNGRMVSFNIEVDLSTVTNFGTGQYKLELPFTPQFGFNHFSGWAWADPNVSPDTGTGHTIINADTAGVTNVLDLHYLKSAGGANTPIREGLFLQGTPVTLTTISKFYINGTYITAE